MSTYTQISVSHCEHNCSIHVIFLYYYVCSVTIYLSQLATYKMTLSPISFQFTSFTSYNGKRKKLSKLIQVEHYWVV